MAEIPLVDGHTYFTTALNFSEMGCFTDIAEFSLSSLTHGGYVSVACWSDYGTLHRCSFLSLPLKQRERPDSHC